MVEKYYLGEKATLIGPFTAKELEARYLAGEINGDTLCWPDKFSNFGWKPLRDFFPHFRSPMKEENDRQEQERQERERREWNENHAVTFKCVDCGKTIRFPLPEFNAIYRCPFCRTEYKTIKTDGAQPVFLVVPQLQNRTDPSCASSKRKQTFPPEVLSALAIFGLDGEATFDAVRRSYREHIKQYHPDMVAHLGPELRKIAELKTKEFNSAYQVLERFYAA